ncbi:MAG TPA: queuosine salvage family protein [Baekduia sp.]
MATSLPETVRAHCARVAATARQVTIDPDASSATAGVVGFDPERHLVDGPPERVARYILVIDTINFGSGWFPTLRHGETEAMTDRLAAFARDRDAGPWWGGELRSLAAADVAAVLDEDPGHELMGLYAEALRQLGAWAGDRDALDLVALAGGSAARFASLLATNLVFFADAGFYKRAQIAANDLVLAGAVAFGDVDDLTVFADNFLPHVLRLDGVLVYDDALAARIDAGEALTPGEPAEQELRACAVHACEQLAARAGVPPRTLDNWLWNRALTGGYAERPAHLCRTVFY